MIKPKLKKCSVCKTPFQPISSWQKACSAPCAHIIGKSVTAAQNRKTKIADKKITKEKLKSLDNLPKLIADAQTSFNLYVRLRAVRFKHGCISCGTPLHIGGVGGGFDCGHYRSRLTAGHLRFNLNAAWGQCKYCNRHLSGNYSEYRVRLIVHIGIGKVERLDNDNRTVKFSREYLLRLKKIFEKKARRIKKRVDLLSL